MDEVTLSEAAMLAHNPRVRVCVFDQPWGFIVVFISNDGAVVAKLITKRGETRRFKTFEACKRMLREIGFKSVKVTFWNEGDES